MENEYPKIHFQKLGKWYVLIEEWASCFDVFLKYYTGKNYLKVDWTTCTEENKNGMKETLFKQALLHKEYYLEKLIEELQDEIYKYEE